jgi:hypothetical protein
MGRMLGLVLLLTLALPMSGSAQQLPTLYVPPLRDGSDDIRVYVLLGQWRRLADDRIEVRTRSGTWMQFPPDGMTTDGKIIPAFMAGFDGLSIRLPHARMDEARRIIEEEIPPHKWGRLEGWPPHPPGWTPPSMNSFGAETKF